jgi:hypothetical protein
MNLRNRDVRNREKRGMGVFTFVINGQGQKVRQESRYSSHWHIYAHFRLTQGMTSRNHKPTFLPLMLELLTLLYLC